MSLSTFLPASEVLNAATASVVAMKAPESNKNAFFSILLRAGY